MVELPESVKGVRRLLKLQPSSEYSEIAGKLLADTVDLADMWRALERRHRPDDSVWVWTFLQGAAEASTLPPYHYARAGERRRLSRKIMGLAAELTTLIRDNGLDAHLVHLDSAMFPGFYFFEDFGESNRARADAIGVDKLNVSQAIERVAARAQEKIKNEPLPGKAGTNARAVRFVRYLVAYNRRRYRSPLNQVVATAANAIFGTSYGPSDIRNLVK